MRLTQRVTQIYIPFISLVDDTAQAVDIEIENIGGAILGEDNIHGIACMQAVHVAANTKSMPIAGPSSSAPNLLHEESNAVSLDDPCLPRTTNDLDGMSYPSSVVVQLRKRGTKSWKRLARKSTKSISTKRGALKRLLELDEEIQSESVTKWPKTNVVVQNSHELSWYKTHMSSHRWRLESSLAGPNETLKLEL